MIASRPATPQAARGDDRRPGRGCTEWRPSPERREHVAQQRVVASPESMLKRSSASRPNVATCHSRKCVSGRCAPTMAFGSPVDPDVNATYAGSRARVARADSRRTVARSHGPSMQDLSRQRHPGATRRPDPESRGRRPGEARSRRAGPAAPGDRQRGGRGGYAGSRIGERRAGLEHAEQRPRRARRCGGPGSPPRRPADAAVREVARQRACAVESSSRVAPARRLPARSPRVRPGCARPRARAATGPVPRRGNGCAGSGSRVRARGVTARSRERPLGRWSPPAPGRARAGRASPRCAPLEEVGVVREAPAGSRRRGRCA